MATSSNVKNADSIGNFTRGDLSSSRLDVYKCLECGEVLDELDSRHLFACCRLTLQEYAIRHSLPMDVLIPRKWINRQDDPAEYACRPSGIMDEEAEAVFSALAIAGKFEHSPPFTVVRGSVRCLDQLLWLGEKLAACGFQFRQEYLYNKKTHRVAADNLIKTTVPLAESIHASAQDIDRWTDEKLCMVSAVVLAVAADFLGGYIFLRLPSLSAAQSLTKNWYRRWGIHSQALRPHHPAVKAYFRVAALSDNDKLLKKIALQLQAVPHAEERFLPRRSAARAAVTKQADFDSAHFITDHPDKCANLHGGRYTLRVTVEDRVDPHTGFVVDYAYLKEVTTQCVLQNLDHKVINYCAAALTWRSSTEILAQYIWLQLLAYLPNLKKLRIDETASSYCELQGCSLEEALHRDLSPFGHFTADSLGESPLRRLLQPDRKQCDY